jgi:hemerythrin-like domain-containing protein
MIPVVTTGMPGSDGDDEGREARKTAVATIKQEHRTLGVVVSSMQQWLAKVLEGHSKADFAFFSAALYYICDFPERYHHPKEEDYLFAALRRRSGRLDPLLDELQSEHVRSARMIAEMEHFLVHYHGGAPNGLASFKAAVDAYAAMLSEHMRREEDLLVRAPAYLDGGDWRHIAAAFAANDDPLLGNRAGAEFGKLYARIVNALPSKLRPGLRDDAP